MLQAILENPDDDGLRLVYAGWPEEHTPVQDQALAKSHPRASAGGSQKQRPRERFGARVEA